MSKKKNRYRKRTKKPRRTKVPNDNHHLFYIRKEWNKGVFNLLRLHPYCVVSIPRETLHWHIHTHLACIPVPNEENVYEVLSQLYLLKRYGALNLDDPIEKRLSILVALFDRIEQPTANALKEQLRLIHEFKKGP